MQAIRGLLLCTLLLSSLAMAEVMNAGSGGFTVRHEVRLPVGRHAAWQAVVNDIGRWWNGDHTVSGDAANLYISPVPMGCFCERLGEGAGLVHLTVTFVNPGVMLRLTGGLGPLGLMGVNGNLTLEFEQDEDDGHTTVALRYAVGGYRPDGMQALAEPVDGVLIEQLDRLANYVAAQADKD